MYHDALSIVKDDDWKSTTVAIGQHLLTKYKQLILFFDGNPFKRLPRIIVQIPAKEIFVSSDVIFPRNNNNKNKKYCRCSCFLYK